MLKSSHDFSYSHYREILSKALKEDYSFVTFDQCKRLPRTKQIVLRHDVDVSLDHAVKMAQIEHHMGIKSTYFLMLHSRFYNLLDEKSLELVQRFVELGHEIGYHYDLEILGRKPAKILPIEVAFVSSIIGVPISVVALHNPTFQRQRFKSPKNDAYSDQFFRRLKYVSDSLQLWREGCLCHQLNRHPRIQALIHPIWWSNSGKHWREILRDRKNQEDRSLSNRFKAYERFIGTSRRLRVTSDNKFNVSLSSNRIQSKPSRLKRVLSKSEPLRSEREMRV